MNYLDRTLSSCNFIEEGMYQKTSFAFRTLSDITNSLGNERVLETESVLSFDLLDVILDKEGKEIGAIHRIERKRSKSKFNNTITTKIFTFAKDRGGSTYD